MNVMWYSDLNTLVVTQRKRKYESNCQGEALLCLGKVKGHQIRYAKQSGVPTYCMVLICSLILS